MHVFHVLRFVKCSEFWLLCQMIVSLKETNNIFFFASLDLVFCPWIPCAFFFKCKIVCLLWVSVLFPRVISCVPLYSVKCAPIKMYVHCRSVIDTFHFLILMNFSRAYVTFLLLTLLKHTTDCTTVHTHGLFLHGWKKGGKYSRGIIISYFVTIRL
jgi:hypothetical protein